MRSDSDIKRDVEDELRWDPSVDATDIAVAVKNGVVTLTGFVRNYMDKFEAEAAAKRVAGVVGLANDIEVGVPGQTKDRIPRSLATPSQRSRADCRSPASTSRWWSTRDGSRSKGR